MARPRENAGAREYSGPGLSPKWRRGACPAAAGLLHGTVRLAGVGVFEAFLAGDATRCGGAGDSHPKLLTYPTPSSTR